MTADGLWPLYNTPADLAAIEQVALAQRGVPETTYAILRRAAAQWPDRPAVSVLPDGQRWQEPSVRSFSRLLADVHRAANLLASIGIRRTSAVTLISPNCDELITATLAAQLAGIAAPINGALSAEHISELVRRSGSRVLIAADHNLDPSSFAVAEQLARAGTVDVLLLLAPTGATCDEPGIRIDGVHIGYLSQLAADHDDAAFAGAEPHGGDLAGLFHTGGTTGAPKLAAHTHTNQVSDAWMIAANSTLNEGSVLFAGLPLFHVNALMVTTLAPLLRGQHVVWAGPLGYRDTALYQHFWKMVAHYAVSAMSAVPTVYATLSQCPIDADISTMQMALVGASPLPAAVRKGFEDHTGIALMEGYGLTEATCASVRSFADHPRPGSVGQRMPYQRLKAVAIGDDGVWHDQPTGVAGHLAVSGPTVFAGYVIERDHTGYVLDSMGKIVDGWLDTGDLAWVDDEGFVHLTGRAKDLIIRGGHNIDPAMIEDILLTHPDVTAASAVGRPDFHAGEVPVAYVTLRAGAGVDVEQLRAWAFGQIAERAAVPKTITVLEALPLTAVGKPYKLALRADAARSAAAEALHGMPGVTAIEAVIEDGATPVVVTIAGDADPAAINDVLGRYPLSYRVQRG